MTFVLSIDRTFLQWSFRWASTKIALRLGPLRVQLPAFLAAGGWWVVPRGAAVQQQAAVSRQSRRVSGNSVACQVSRGSLLSTGELNHGQRRPICPCSSKEATHHLD